MARNATKSSTQDFSKSVHANIPRSIFYRPSNLKTTFNAGDLVPVYIDEILPGDTYQMKLQHVARTITPLVPVMDNIKLEFFAFFVPNRIVWSGWEALNGENKSDSWTPDSSPSPVPHYSNVAVQNEGVLGDYYGIPVGMDLSHHSINVLPFRGYRKIWNDWFRNQNVQAPLVEYTGDTTSSGSVTFQMPLQKVNKPFDYFTACLPEPQKGDSSLIPINLNELIPIISGADTTMSSGTSIRFYQTGTTTPITTSNSLATLAPTGSMVAVPTGDPAGSTNVSPRNLWADATNLTFSGSTINDLRTAFQIQRLYERDARGGTRYVEMLKAHFGVDAGDYRLQKPEYLGKVSSLVNINQVAQTSETGTTPQANLAAYGHSQGDDSFFTKSFVEHGFLHILCVARHKKTYQQGLDRFWSRRDRLDYYYPVLGHISEQPVYTKELYALADNAETVFGYQEAWSDYRYKPSKVTGEMRAAATNSFDIWHYADEYSSEPTLSDAWMQDNSETNLDRTLAVSNVSQIKLDVRFDLKATRPIPMNSIPGYIDHF